MDYLDVMDFREDSGYSADYTFDFDESGSDARVNRSDNSVQTVSDITVASIKNPFCCHSYPLQCQTRGHYFV
jgi:hypothetical protein